MIIQEASQYLIRQLRSVYDASEASNIAEWVLESITNFDRLAQKIHSDEPLGASQVQKMASYIRELLDHRPVQYVLGECYFMDMKLFVDENVLVPRPETEELADWIIKYCRSQGREKGLTILDIGTGSGCIALALKKHLPESKVTAVDISEGALNIAGRNAANLGLEVEWMQSDILDEKGWGRFPEFDIIVSNPPYITLPEKESILPNVLRYEPHQALFVTDEDPQQFYKAIEAFSRLKLRKDGCVFMELHRDFAKDTKAYYEDRKWRTVLRKDMQENERMLMVVRE